MPLTTIFFADNMIASIFRDKTSSEGEELTFLSVNSAFFGCEPAHIKFMIILHRFCFRRYYTKVVSKNRLKVEFCDAVRDTLEGMER